MAGIINGPEYLKQLWPLLKERFDAVYKEAAGIIPYSPLFYRYFTKPQFGIFRIRR